MKGLESLAAVLVTILVLICGHAVGQYCPGIIETACCPEGDLFWNASGLFHVRQNGSIQREFIGQYEVHVMETGSLPNYNGEVCATNALIMVQFERMSFGDEENVQCMSGNLCGRRILRIEFTIERNATEDEWIFEIGDLRLSYRSGILNNPPGTILEAKRGRLRQHVHSRCGNRPITYVRGVKNISRIILYISHQFITLEVDGSAGRRIRGCSDCLWNLNKVFIPNVILMGINRSIYGWNYDRGRGICNVRFSWVCPYCDGLSQNQGATGAGPQGSTARVPSWFRRNQSDSDARPAAKKCDIHRSMDPQVASLGKVFSFACIASPAEE